MSENFPAHLLPWLGPGSWYNAQNILLKGHSFDVQTKIDKDVHKSFACAQQFGVYSSIENVSNFLEVNPELLASFLLKTTDSLQFFQFERETVLVYVCYVAQECKMVTAYPGCVNKFKTGYSYLVALDASLVPKTYDQHNRPIFDCKTLKHSIEQLHFTDPFLSNCKVLLNWAPSTIGDLKVAVRNYSLQAPYVYLFYELTNVQWLKTKYAEEVNTIMNTERIIQQKYANNILVAKAWTLAKKLISSYPQDNHFLLLHGIWESKNLNDFYQAICFAFGNIYMDRITKIGANILYKEILDLNPAVTAVEPMSVDHVYNIGQQPQKDSSSVRWLDVPAKFLPFLRPGSVYDAGNILNDLNQLNTSVKTDAYKNNAESVPSVEKFGIYPHKEPSIKNIADFLKIDPELFAHFLLTSSSDVRQFFNFERDTVLVYVYYVDQKMTATPQKNNCINYVETGYSYIVALDAHYVSNAPLDRYYQFEILSHEIEQKRDFSDPMIQSCKVLLNWAPSTIEKLRNCVVSKSECGNLFYTISNVQPLKTDYSKLLKRVMDIEQKIKQEDILVQKSWTLASKLILNNLNGDHQELWNCFQNVDNLDTFHKKICIIFGREYMEQILVTDALLFSEILAKNSTDGNQNSTVRDSQNTNDGIKAQQEENTLCSKHLETKALAPQKKVEVTIPSGSGAFWQKVFKDQDVVIKQSDVFDVNMTTTTGKKRAVKLIQPLRFRGISVINDADKTFKKNNELFACQFCAILLNVDSENDELIYCRCGKFKDSDIIPANHNFASRKPKFSSDQKNVLLIGASGAGKSTLINNMANLVKFRTQTDAYNGELTAVIPSRFVVGKGRDTLDVETIIVGKNLEEAQNEQFNDFGQSVTQRPHMCSITAELPSGETKKFNFIDTPGINDTRGLDQDDVNIDHIKRAVLQAGYLHAICIVLLPNQSRMEADFESVLRRLLQFVPLEHRPNLVFFFTNTRSTLFRPGQTYPVLQNFAKAQPKLEIPLDQDRLFCFDSESFNFLCAHHHGIEYDLTGPEHYNDSWNASQKSLYRFFEFLNKVKPFSTSEIGFLETARGLFIKCAKAVSKFSKTETYFSTAEHLIGVLASSLNGEVQKAREIAQAVEFTEDIKLLRYQQLAFFRQLTKIDGLLKENLSANVVDFCDLYEPCFKIAQNETAV